MFTNGIAVLEEGNNTYLITPKETFKVLLGAPTLEAAVAALLEDVPPYSVKCMVVMNLNDYDCRRRYVEALQAAGYRNIESIDSLSVSVCTNILTVPLKNAVGDHVAVYIGLEYGIPLVEAFAVIIEKCQKGYKIVRSMFNGSLIPLVYPFLRDVVMVKGTPEAVKAEVRSFFPGFQYRFHYADKMDEEFKIDFVQKRINGDDFNGREVLPYCNIDLKVQFGNKDTDIKLTDRSPPFTFTEEVYVGDASEVKVLPYFCPDKKFEPLKSLKFKNPALRTVAITVDVDKTLLPKVTIRTATTHKLPARTDRVIYVIKCEYSDYLLETVHHDRIVDEGRFESPEDVVDYMNEETPICNVSDIYVVHDDAAGYTELWELVVACRQGGHPTVKFISEKSVALSMLLDRAGVCVETGQSVAVLARKAFYAVEREGKFLKIVKTGTSTDFDPKKSKATTVVVDNSTNAHTKKALNQLRNALSPRTVHILSGTTDTKQLLIDYYWNSIDANNDGANIFNPFGDLDFLIKGTGIAETLKMRYESLPYENTVDLAVGRAKKLNVVAFKSEAHQSLMMEYDVPNGAKFVRCVFRILSPSEYRINLDPIEKPENLGVWKMMKSPSTAAVKSAESPGLPKSRDIKVEAIGASSSLPKKLSNVQLNPPKTVLTFTSDNRVLIEADKAYTGYKEVLAYVQLEDGKPPIVGQLAFDVLKTRPESVFYDITRLLATKFDPNPSWSFKTSRDTDGKVVVRGGDNITTFPIVLFGIVVRSTLLYIREHTKSEISTLGIQLPVGSSINDADLKTVSERIEVELMLV